MPYCQSCGSHNDKNARFCSKCGNRIEMNDYNNTVVSEVENPNAYRPEKQYVMPETYLWQSIAVTVLCCIPLGIPAIVFASQVQSRYISGDIEGSRASSEKARKFCIAALVTGIVVGILYGIFFFIVGIGEVLLGY